MWSQTMRKRQRLQPVELIYPAFGTQRVYSSSSSSDSQLFTTLRYQKCLFQFQNTRRDTGSPERYPTLLGRLAAPRSPDTAAIGVPRERRGAAVEFSEREAQKRRSPGDALLGPRDGRGFAGSNEFPACFEGFSRVPCFRLSCVWMKHYSTPLKLVAQR